MTELIVPWNQRKEIVPQPTVNQPIPTTTDQITTTAQPTTTDQAEIYTPWTVRQTQQSVSDRDQYSPAERFSAKWLGDPDELSSLGRRIATEVVPGVEGAVLGAQYGSTTGVPAGRFIGGALGGAFGSLTGKRLDEIFGNVRPDEQTLISDIITAAGGAWSAPGAMTTTQTQAVLKYLRKAGIKKPTPGVVSDRQIIQTIEQKLKELPFSGGRMDVAVQQMYDDLGRAVDHLADESTIVFRSPSEAGEAISKSAQSRLDAYHWRGGVLYDIVKKLVGDQNPSVNPGRLNKVIEDLGVAGYDNTKLGQIFGDDVLKALGGALEGGGSQSWRDMEKVLRRVGDKMRYNSGEDLGVMKQLYGAIANDMDVAVRGMGKHEQKAWHAARDFWKRMVVEQEEQLGKIATHADPQKLFEALTRGNLSKVARAKNAVGGENWTAVQDLVIRRMGEVPGKEGVFNTRQFLSQWKTIKKDSNAASTLFGDRLSDIETLAGVARRLQAPGLQANTSRTGAGNVIFGLLTGTTAVAGYASGDLTGAAIGMALPVIAPYVVSRVWTSPTLLKWMVRGTNIPINSFKQTSAWAKAFLKLAAAEGINEYESLQMHDLIMSPFQSDLPRVPTQ